MRREDEQRLKYEKELQKAEDRKRQEQQKREDEKRMDEDSKRHLEEERKAHTQAIKKWAEMTSVADIQTDAVTFAHRRLLGEIARSGDLPLRLDFYVAPNKSGDELEQFKSAAEALKPLSQSELVHFAGFVLSWLRHIDESVAMTSPKGAQIDGAAKERFRRAAQFFATGGYNFHLPALRDATARQLLSILEEVHQATPFASQRIVFAGLEDTSPETIERIKKLGGGIAIVDRMALAGERYAEAWGIDKARNAPPLRAMAESGIPMSAGTEAHLSSSYSPMLALWWLVTGKTVAGTAMRNPSQNLTRAEALRLFTSGGAWVAYHEGRKGSIEPGKFADLVVLSADYLTVPEDQIRTLEALITIVGGRIVYAAGPYAGLGRK